MTQEVKEEIDRILQLWAQARARFGGTGAFLFGDWCAADIMYAPVVTASSPTACRCRRLPGCT